MPATLSKEGDLLEIKLEGRWSEIAEAKDKVRDLPGRAWNPEKKVWTVPADPQTADRILKSIRPDVDDELMAWIKESMTSREESLTTPLPEDAELSLPWARSRAPWQPQQVNDEIVNGLTPVQRTAVDAIVNWRRALLCDDMGLGKTLTMIAAAEEFRLRSSLGEVGPKLIIAPASVLGSWKRELLRWLDDPPLVVVDAATPAKRHAQLVEGIKYNAWIVANWEQIRTKKIKVKEKTKNGGTRTKTYSLMKEPLYQWPGAWRYSFEAWEDPKFHEKQAKTYAKAVPWWYAVFADEIHRAKNRDAQQTQGLHRLRGELMVGATGTPIMNSPDELWSLLRWLWPNQYHERGQAHAPGAMSYWSFYEMYVDYWEDHYGRKVITGVKNPDALRYVLNGKVIRRIADWEHGGKKRIYFDVALTPKQQKLYDEAEKALWLAIEKDAVAGNKEALALAKLAAEGKTTVELLRIDNGAARFVRLQQIIENAALLGGDDESAVMDDFEEKYADSRPEPWLVFCKYRKSCELLADRLHRKFGAKVEIYNGDTPPRRRTEIEDEFQRGEIDVIVGTIEAMFQGITLTRSHLQYWLSRDVVPAKNEQGEDRQNRKGQQRQVLVYIPQAIDTVSPNRVHVINRLKEGIVKTILPQAEIQEA